MQLEKGAATAAAVLDMVTEFPGQHDQGSFVSPCGTKMCTAGWAAHLHGYSAQQIRALENTPGTTSHPTFRNHRMAEIVDVAGDLLGLERAGDRHRLFYLSNRSEAVEALEWIAAGKDLEWKEISDRAAVRSLRERQCC